MEQKHITIIGAGIVGISIALELQNQGYKARVIDRSGVANEASAGSAGAFAFADIVPLATPGIMMKAPKWLLDPLGPLSVPPAYALKITPWMLRFWRASWRDRYHAALTAQSSLNGFSLTALERQINNVDGEPLMQRDGQLQLYEGEQEFRASLKLWDVRREFGIAFEHLKSPTEIAEIQPGLDSRFTHAAFTPDWMNTIDPRSWAEHLAKVFVTRGGEIDHVEVLALEQSGDGINLMTPNGPLHTPKVIVAAGAWSHHLARTLGDHIPLETERGYNTTLPAGAFDLRTQLTFGGHGFVASRINGGVRIGGAVELGGLNLPPNFKRAEILLEKAAQFLPDLKIDHGKQWMGFRPSMPDSLPVIGTSKRASNVIYAFGHGHLGLTQSAGTAELVAELISGKTTAVSVAPFAPTRF
ncbi:MULTISPECIES: NAD(P)/FAD-dependent oxidoreductase [Pacificibacter]|uniref:NAD(P)/FAD-dependent oxidoreductase n=1 Tax=Pacificibacter TaxID=1042323 RepID=UPI001C09EDB9|nr:MULTISPECIES: FAD-binding oxidoreductase [Pacificibacter]MBU2934672.1 FAD-binding oxidoreductase [Pacificibacter marinus]MDO6616509.1 FAD-binding oxidoreductase [Pacificibacter sp. 1_MG-2023]